MKTFTKISSAIMLFCLTCTTTSLAISSDELISFYEGMVGVITQRCSSELIMDIINLHQNIRSIIAPHTGDIGLDEEIALRTEVETCIKKWLCTHGLPSSLFNTAGELGATFQPPTQVLCEPSTIILDSPHTSSREEFPAGPPPSPASSAHSKSSNDSIISNISTLTISSEAPCSPMRQQILTHITALNLSHLLAINQAHVLHTAAISLADHHIAHLKDLLFFMISKNLYALSRSHYTASALGFDVYANVDTCLEFYAMLGTIDTESKDEISALVHTLHPVALDDFIRTFFSAINSYLAGDNDDFDFADTLLHSYSAPEVAVSHQKNVPISIEHLAYHTDNLTRTPRSQLISYIDNLVFHGLLHQSDGWRLRSLMLIALPKLCTHLMLEAFSLSSAQCFTLSRCLSPIVTHYAALQNALRLHCDRGDIDETCCTEFGQAIVEAPSADLLRVEHNFYIQLLKGLEFPQAPSL